MYLAAIKTVKIKVKLKKERTSLFLSNFQKFMIIVYEDTGFRRTVKAYFAKSHPYSLSVMTTFANHLN